MANYLLCLLQLILSPGNGWIDISAEGRDPRRVATRGFYPLVAVVALSALARWWYGDMEMFTAVVSVLVTFVKYFVTYFIAAFIFPLYSNAIIEGEYNETRTSTFILYTLGLLALINLLRNLLPIDVGIVSFLPFYVLLIMWKGKRYMAVKGGKTLRFIALSVACIMLPVYLIGWLFVKIM